MVELDKKSLLGRLNIPGTIFMYNVDHYLCVAENGLELCEMTGDLSRLDIAKTNFDRLLLYIEAVAADEAIRKREMVPLDLKHLEAHLVRVKRVVEEYSRELKSIV